MVLLPGPPAWYEWDGSRWYRNREGYYQDRTGSLLHVVIWEHTHQRAVPDAHVIHHIDHDRGNNDPGNLGLLSRADHARHHNADRGPDHPWNQTSEHARTAVNALWANKQPVERICEQCEQPYSTRSTYSKFCGPNCRATFYRRARRFSRPG